MSDVYLGYITSGGNRGPAQRLEGTGSITTFLKDHFYEDEVVITDSGDNLVFRAVDGVDIYSALDAMGIDLPAIYQDIREAWDVNETQAKREPWEDLYDNIGLSAGEVRMRQRVKRACKTAKTVEDVAHLLEGTYFDVHFYSEDRLRAWGYFNPDDYSIQELEGNDEDDVGDKHVPHIITLNPNARVKHISSSEDVHRFVLFDPPLE